MSLLRIDSPDRRSFILFSNLAKQLSPVCHQRLISSMTPASVNFGRYRRNDSSTLTMIVCRRAPTSVLLVRPVLRAVAAPRNVRSASLFVPATGWLLPFGCVASLAVTKVNSCNFSSVSSLQSEPGDLHLELRRLSRTLVATSRLHHPAIAGQNRPALARAGGCAVN